MAYKMNNAIIPPQRGLPLQFVAESKWAINGLNGLKRLKFLTLIIKDIGRVLDIQTVETFLKFP
jgi:DMSO/TMAO reductase YedYZ molybdopterin-dependent catalytic subunit